jgi:hypothetical protein
VKRPSPPHFTRQKNQRISATDLPALRRQHTHLQQKLISGQRQQILNARILQRRHAVAARTKHMAGPPRKGSAEVAIAVEEQPATSRPPSFTVSYF